MLTKIEDVRKALSNGCYLSALALALTLPDICARVKQPDVNIRGTQYAEWFNENVHVYERESQEAPVSTYEGREFDGGLCWQLRCAYLHAGNLDVIPDGNDDVDKGKYETKMKLTKFELSLSSHVDAFGTVYDNESQAITHTIRLDIRQLCERLCDAAEAYYNGHHDKDQFEEHTIKIVDIEGGANVGRRILP